VERARCHASWQIPVGIVWALLVAGCASSPGPAEQAPSPPVVIERSDHTHALAPGRAIIRIDNPWGNVELRSTGRRELVVHAVVQRIGPLPEQARIELGGDTHTAKLDVSFDRSGRECARRLPGGARVGRVDLSVFIPRDVAVEVTLDCDGALATDLVRGDLVARTQSGGISAAATGAANLRSESGRIRAYLALATPEPSLLRTAGPVVATIPAAASTRLMARACGKILTRDLELDQETGADGCTTGRANVGEGGPEVSIESGSWIELRRQTGTRE